MLVELRGELLMDGAEEDPLARYFGAAQAQEECEQAGRQAGELRKRALRDLYQREGSLAKVAAMVGLSRAQVHKLIK
jgi:AraC-like DNA-binding protein